MKKRILSIALALVMLLSLALISCNKDDGDSTPPPAELQTYSLKDKMVYTGEEQTAKPTTQVVGPLSYRDDAYLFTSFSSQNAKVYRSDVYETEIIESVEQDVYKGELYEVLFFKSGTKLEYFLPDTTNLTEEQMKTTYTDVNFYSRYISGVYTIEVVLSKNYGDAYDHILISDRGVALAQENDYGYSSSINSNSSRIRVATFCGKLYRVEVENSVIKSFTKIMEVSDVYNAMYFVSNCTYIPGAYIYQTGSIYRVFDESFNEAGYFEFERTPGSDVEFTRLDDGRLYIVEVVELPDSATEYDILIEGEKAFVSAYTYDFNSKTLTELGTPEYVSYNEVVTPSALKEMGYSLSDPTVALVMSEVIEVKTSTYYGESKLLALDKDMKPLYFIELPSLGNYEFRVHPTGAIIFENAYESYISDTMGNKIANLPADANYNNNWFITAEGIFDNKMTLVYDYAAANRTIYRLFGDSIIFREVKEIEGGSTETHYILWNGTGDGTLIAKDSEIYDFTFRDTFFYTEIYNEETFYYTVTFYASNGTLLASIDNVDDFYSLSIGSGYQTFEFDIYDEASSTYLTRYYTLNF